MKEIPEFLEKLLIEQYGNELTNKIIDGYSKKRIVTLRVNTIKSNKDKIKQVLDNLNILYEEVSWYNDALVIKNALEKDLIELDIYKNGEIYLQSLSSMIPALVLNPKEGEIILDMASAPGGKTTQTVALSNNKALITACEKNKIRADRLKYNLNLQGANRVGVIVNDARHLDDFLTFDKILLDSPCSGSGTLLISDDLNNKISEDLVKRSSNIQLELIRKAIKLLKLNGELVYSTCSILKSENEDIIKKVLKDGKVELVPIDKDSFSDIPLLPCDLSETLLVCPTYFYEGFFVAKLRKK